MEARIQRKRIAGWKKPVPDAIWIGYKSKWGNPFKWKDLPGGKVEAQAKYKAWLPGAIEKGEIDIEPLRGKVLMCYCKPEETCHGDIIIGHLENRKE
jgi:hypothetical protein